MAKVYPQQQESTTSSDFHDQNQCHNNKRETYTVWMKSLILHSNGCTVYDSNGEIVYRVDNYDRKGRTQVHLMDLQGNLLCNIKKKLLAFGCWKGSNFRNQDEEQPWFQVKRCNKVISGKIACKIKVGCQNFCIERLSTGKASAIAFRIVNKDGQIIAEVKQKQTESGVILSNDVLTLDLAAGTDRSLIMALVTVYGLICGYYAEFIYSFEVTDYWFIVL